eukprot:10498762-Alexandrium_andersonii.AAC.1
MHVSSSASLTIGDVQATPSPSWGLVIRATGQPGQLCSDGLEPNMIHGEIRRITRGTCGPRVYRGVG